MDIFLSDFSPTQKICRNELLYPSCFSSFDGDYGVPDSSLIHRHILPSAFWDDQLEHDAFKSTNLIFWHILIDKKIIDLKSVFIIIL